MPRLKAANNARTTLAQAVSNSDTTIYVQDITPFPSPPFRITVDNEIMEVTAIDTNNKAFTVLRAQEGTTATTHSIGATVENRFTAGTYNELLDATGNAATATKLQTARTISLTGDATGSTTFDGSADKSITVTLANSGVTAGTYTKVTVDSKGRVTSGSNPTTLSGYGITDGVQNAGNTPSIQAGLDNSKPLPSVAGRLYVATDTQIIYRDTGTAWQKVGVVKWGDIEGKPASFTPATHGNEAHDPDFALASDLTAHLADTAPHQFIDEAAQKTYRYGFKKQDNHLVFMYEEVV